MVSVAVADLVPPEVDAQIAATPVVRGRPLIITDADEVLVAFMAALEVHLSARELYFDWSSFRLTGNIRRRRDDSALEAEAVQHLLGEFFVAHTEALDPIPGAGAALAALSKRAQIVVLSNLPLAQRQARRRALGRHGMDYPVIANVGPKGPAVRALTAAAAAPTFFVDDAPSHHRSVAALAASVYRLHFVGDRRLFGLLGDDIVGDHRTDNWTEARAVIESRLAEAGY